MLNIFDDEFLIFIRIDIDGFVVMDCNKTAFGALDLFDVFNQAVIDRNRAGIAAFGMISGQIGAGS